MQMFHVGLERVHTFYSANSSIHMKTSAGEKQEACIKECLDERSRTSCPSRRKKRNIIRVNIRSSCQVNLSSLLSKFDVA